MSTLQKIQIQGPGLKKEGIVVLQTLFIGFFVFIEMTIRTGVGILTGIAICAALSMAHFALVAREQLMLQLLHPHWLLPHLHYS
jgi:hypothetical protein